MSMLHELRDRAVWEAFLQSKIERQHLSEKEQEAWREFISEEKYRAVTDRLTEPDYVFAPPVKIDLSRVTVNKMKAKIRRKAHALYRRRVRRDQDFTYAAKALVRTFNKKYFDEAEENRFTWSRWFFPVITTDEGLKELDAYLIQYIRYLYSGRHYKGNYKVTYEEIKELGFRSLVHEYYKGKEV